MDETKFRAIVDNKIENKFEVKFTLREISLPVFCQHYRLNEARKWIYDGNKPDQFTGIQDKDDEDVYKNDIICVEEWTCDKWTRGSPFIVKIPDIYSHPFFEDAGPVRLVKLGNIYENPELVEES